MFDNFTHSSRAHEANAQWRLSKAEEFIRLDQPHEAWEILGEGNKPPEAWPLLLRPSWHWLAGWALRLLGRLPEAVQCLEQGMQLAESLGLLAPPAERAHWDEIVERLRCFLGITYCAKDEPAMAFQYHHRCLEAIRQDRMKDPELKLWVYRGLGNACLPLARYQEAIGFYREALKHTMDSTDKRQQGYIAWGLAVAYQQQGDLFRAKTRYQEALQTLGKYGNLLFLAQIRAALGLLLVNLQEYEEAEKYLQKSLEGARSLGDLRTTGLAWAFFASLYLAKGEPEQAIQAAQAGLPLAQQSMDHRTMAHLYLVLASAYTATQDPIATEQALQEAVKVGEQIADSDLLGQARQRYADFLAEQKRFREAYQELLLLGLKRAG